jgi:enoyl-CoA hydratase
MTEASTVSYEIDDCIAIVTIERSEARNAVNRPTAQALAAAFRRFDSDASSSVAILTGRGGVFCAGADLKQIAAGRRGHRVESGDAPMGPTRLKLSKPVIAAIEGPAVAGGLELALWCNLRVAARDAIFGVYCRRFGVPLMDLGTIRLPRLIGHSRATDLILTGRGISGEEASASVTSIASWHPAKRSSSRSNWRMSCPDCRRWHCAAIGSRRSNNGD